MKQARMKPLVMVCIFLILVLILYLIVKTSRYESFTNQPNKFKLVVTTYNPGNYLQECLESIAMQQYKNYDVCIVEDKSTENVDMIHNTIKYFCNKYDWKYIIHTENTGPLKSRIDAIDKLDCKDNDIIVLIDGDDKLSCKNVLDILNKYYQEDIYATFGSFMSRYGNKIGKQLNIFKCNKNFSKIAKDRLIRQNFYYSHLKTFKYYLYKHIDHEKSFKRNGEYYRAATDIALMFPILELAGTKFKCVPEILYHYTQDHPESFHNVGKRQQQRLNYQYMKQLEKYNAIV